MIDQQTLHDFAEFKAMMAQIKLVEDIEAVANAMTSE